MLLVSKPIRHGDVIGFEKSSSGASWGWFTDMNLNYVQVATRKGTSLLIPNEVFVTQNIENLSYDDTNLRLDIPFGIAYESDLNKAKTLAISAAMRIDRVLKIPEPSTSALMIAVSLRFMLSCAMASYSRFCFS